MCVAQKNAKDKNLRANRQQLNSFSSLKMIILDMEKERMSHWSTCFLFHLVHCSDLTVNEKFFINFFAILMKWRDAGQVNCLMLE